MVEKKLSAISGQPKQQKSLFLLKADR